MLFTMNSILGMKSVNSIHLYEYINMQKEKGRLDQPIKLSSIAMIFVPEEDSEDYVEKDQYVDPVKTFTDCVREINDVSDVTIEYVFIGEGYDASVEISIKSKADPTLS